MSLLHLPYTSLSSRRQIPLFVRTFTVELEEEVVVLPQRRAVSDSQQRDSNVDRVLVHLALHICLPSASPPPSSLTDGDS